jgi:hypothetical protein
MKEEGLEANPPGKTAERLPMNFFLARFYQIVTLLPSLSFNTFLHCGFDSGQRARLCYRKEYPPVIVAT